MPFLFPFQPNWNESFKVELSYKTEIIVSRNFKEQRFALRTQPRKQVSFTINPRRGRLSAFMDEFSSQQQAAYVVAEPTRSVVVSTVAMAGDSALYLEGAAAPVWAASGAYLVVSGAAGPELVLVDTALPGVLVLDQPLSNDVAAGARVSPGLVGRVSQSLSGQLLTNMTGKFDIDFAADPGLNIVEGVTSAPLAFNGRELFLLKPNWRTSPNFTLEGLLETTDYGRGRVEHFAPVNFNQAGLRLEFLQKTSAEVEALCQFFHRMKGQQGEFYMPTWGDDFDLSIGCAAGASVLDTPGVAKANMLGSSTIYRAAIAFFKDGTYQVNKIATLAAASGNSRFSFVSPWAKALNDSTVKLMCWLPVWRLAVDTMTLEWPTAVAAQTQLTMRALEDL